MGLKDVTVYGDDGKSIPLLALVNILREDRLENFKEVNIFIANSENMIKVTRSWYHYNQHDNRWLARALRTICPPITANKEVAYPDRKYWVYPNYVTQKSFVVAKFGATRIFKFIRNRNFDLEARTVPGDRHCLHRLLTDVRIEDARLVWK